MKKELVFSFSLLVCLCSFAQSTEPFVELQIDRVEITGRKGIIGADLDERDITRLCLAEKAKRIKYDDGYGGVNYSTYTWLDWEQDSFSSILLPDGSSCAQSSNGLLNVSLNLHPEWLIAIFKNNSPFYIVINLGSLTGFVSLSELNSSQLSNNPFLGTISLTNHLSTTYHTVLLPPLAEISIPYYCTTWYFGDSSHDSSISRKNYRIVHEDIEHNTRIDFQFEMKLFSSNPLLLNENFMRTEQSYTYSPRTPKVIRLNYRGPYFQDGSSLYIYEDYDYLFNNSDFTIKENIITSYKKSNTPVTVSENEYGFYQFSGKFQGPSSFQSSDNQNNESSPAKIKEPVTKLGATLNKIKSEIPNLVYIGDNRGMQEYENDGIEYTFKNGLLVCQTTDFQGGNGLGKRAYDKFVERFKQTNYKRVTETDHSVTFFYSTFSASINYWSYNDSFGLTYQSYDYWEK